MDHGNLLSGPVMDQLKAQQKTASFLAHQNFPRVRRHDGLARMRALFGVHRVRVYGLLTLVLCVLATLVELGQYATFPGSRALAPNFVSNPDIPYSLRILGVGCFWAILGLFFPILDYLAGRFPLGSGHTTSHVAIHSCFAILFASVYLTAGAAIQMWLHLDRGDFVAHLVWTFRVFFVIAFLLYWGMLACVIVFRSLDEVRAKELRASQLEANLAVSQLKVMESRLNPHFFFNALNSISGLASLGETSKIIEVVGVLSGLMRRTITQQGPSETTVKEELAFVEDYLKIQRLRFPDRLAVSWQVDSQVLGATIPSMIMQPIVENSIEHGVARKPGPGNIAILVERLEESLVIEVRDTGPGFGGEARVDNAGCGFSLKSTAARLKYLYGDSGLLECRNCPAGGALVRISFPFHTMAVQLPNL